MQTNKAVPLATTYLPICGRVESEHEVRKNRQAATVNTHLTILLSNFQPCQTDDLLRLANCKLCLVYSNRQVQGLVVCLTQLAPTKTVMNELAPQIV